MSPAQLLAHFQHLAEAPDAIPRLRRFILDLAVLGRLVPQDPNDEPGPQLLRQIQTEQARLLKMGAIKRLRSVSRIEDAEISFSVPRGWVWVRLGELLFGDSQNGYSKKPDEALDGVPILRISAGTARRDGVVAEEEYKLIGGVSAAQQEQYGLQPGDLLACRFNGNRNFVGRLSLYSGYLGIKPIYPDKLIRLRLLQQFVLPKLVRSFAESSVVRRDVENYCATTVGNWGISASNLKDVKIPLPPLAEQHRIVAKVDELMALCERLRAAQAERESRRDRLVTASLHGLNNGADVDAFHERARFHLRHLPRLTTRTEHLQQLRQTILDLAVRGRLVPQDPSDEPASELLKRIQAEQRELVRAGTLKRSSRDSQLPQGTLPFAAPPAWQWAPLGILTTFGPQNGISPKVSSRPDAPKAITLTATTSGHFNPDHFKPVDATIPHDSEFWLRPGDLLFQRGNTREYVGIAAYYTGETGQFLYPDLMMKVRLTDRISLRYVHLCAIAPPARAYFSTHASGAQATMPKINQGTLLALPVPIAPLAEQHRIVAKVGELMAVCDQLEAQLTTAQTESRRLLEAVLYEALASAA